MVKEETLRDVMAMIGPERCIDAAPRMVLNASPPQLFAPLMDGC
jgi:hypothetical protein